MPNSLVFCIVFFQANPSLWDTKSIYGTPYLVGHTKDHHNNKTEIWTQFANHYISLIIAQTKQYLASVSTALLFQEQHVPGPIKMLCPLIMTLVKNKREDRSLLRPGRTRDIFSVLVVSTWYITVVMVFQDLLLHAHPHGWTHEHQTHNSSTLCYAVIAPRSHCTRNIGRLYVKC